MKDFTWLADLSKEEKDAFGKVISVFLRGMTEEDLDGLDVEDEACLDSAVEMGV